MNTRKKTLLIMAAGLGSRYGGNKQVDKIGPDGEILMQYSIFDAINAGFTKIVFIIKPEYTELINEISADARANGIETAIAYQDFSTLPAFYDIPSERVKPFGTVHAVLSAKELISEPFAIINADDFYGRDAFFVMSKALDGVSDECGAMVAYELKNTVSKNGSVTRGVCQTSNGMLTDIVETLDIILSEDGSIIDESAGELSPTLPVSMNMWGFTPKALELMQSGFESFLRSVSIGDIKAEYPLPTFIGEAIQDSKLTIKVYTTSAEWFGVTYAEDRPQVAKNLEKMKKEQLYPEGLKL